MLSCEERSLGVIDRIVSVFTRYIFFARREFYHLCLIYVLMTHVYTKFDQIPYFLIYGPKGTGKSRLGAIQRGLCQNGEYSSDVTPALLMRLIDKKKKGITVILDEAEKFPDLMLRILRSGYRQDGRTGRWNIRDDNAEWFETFCPKILINQGGFNDPALESRIIAIPMVKSEICLERFLAQDVKKKFEEIQTLINSFVDEYGEVIDREYKTFEAVEGLSDRDLEVWTPILVIASVLDSTLPYPFLKEEMLGLAKKMIEREKKTQLIGDRDGQILEGTRAFIEHTDPVDIDGQGYYVGEDLLRFIKNRWSIPGLRLETVSRTLRRLNIILDHKRPRMRGQRDCYQFDIELLNKLTKDFFEEGEKP